MAENTFQAEGIVLAKTKLGEADLILRLLIEDGSLLETIAKGARKPTNPFATRLELFNCAHILCAFGRNLDIIKECRLLESFKALHGDPLRSAAASCVAEHAVKLAQPGLVAPRMYKLTRATLQALDRCNADHLPLLIAAYLLKSSSFSGMRPSLSHCACCSQGVALEPSMPTVRFSFTDGGIICQECVGQCELTRIATATIAHASFLLTSTYDEILRADVPADPLDALQFAHRWVIAQIGSSLRSLKGFISYSRLL